MLNLSHVRILLESCQKRFESYADRDLHVAVIRAVNDAGIESTRPDLGNPLDPDNVPDERGSFPTSRSLRAKQVLLRRPLAEILSSGSCPPQDLVYFGDHEALAEYRAISIAALDIYLNHRNNLQVSFCSQILSQAIEEIETIDSFVDSRSHDNDHEIWTLILLDQLNEIDRGSGQIIERWVWERSEELPWGDERLVAGRYWDQPGVDVEASALERHRVVTTIPRYDPFKLSTIMINEILNLIDSNKSALQVPFKQSRLLAHLESDPPYISLDGAPCSPFDIASTRYVAALIEANGWPVSFSEFLKRNPEFEGAISTRKLDEIPEVIARFIKRPGKGSSPSLDVELLQGFSREESAQ